VTRLLESIGLVSKERQIENSFKRAAGALPIRAEICVSND